MQIFHTLLNMYVCEYIFNGDFFKIKKNKTNQRYGNFEIKVKFRTPMGNPVHCLDICTD